MRISNLSNINFKGIYLSNALAPGYQRERAKEIRDDFIKNGLDLKYESDGQDILIDPSPDNENEICMRFIPYSVKRILDDDYSRWNGRFN